MAGLWDSPGAAYAVKVRGSPGAGIIAEVKGPISTNVMQSGPGGNRGCVFADKLEPHYYLQEYRSEWNFIPSLPSFSFMT